MSYKVCSTCQFVMAQVEILCTTCGSNSFAAEEDIVIVSTGHAPSAPKPIMGRRTTTTHYLPSLKPARFAAPAAPVHTLRKKLREYVTTHSSNQFSWGSHR